MRIPDQDGTQWNQPHDVVEHLVIICLLFLVLLVYAQYSDGMKEALFHSENVNTLMNVI